MKPLLILLLALLPLVAQTTRWEGSIGQQKAYMQLSCETTKKEQTQVGKESYYFLANRLLNVKLKGLCHADGTLELNATWNKHPEELQLKQHGNTLTGRLLRGNEQLPVLFKSVKVPTLDRIKTLLLKYRTVKQERVKRPAITLGVQWVLEEYSHIAFPRVLQGFSKKRERTINARLKKLHQEKALYALACSYGWSEHSGQELLVTIGYVSQSLFSLVYIDMQSCEGAVEQREVYGALYATDTGKPYTLEHLLAFAKHTPIRTHKREKAWRAYRKKYFAPKIRDLIFAEKGWKIGGKEDQACDYSNTKYWEEVAWFLGKKGLEIKPHYTGEQTGCRDQYSFILSADLLKQYKNRNYPHVLDEYIQDISKNR